MPRLPDEVESCLDDRLLDRCPGGELTLAAVPLGLATVVSVAYHHHPVVTDLKVFRRQAEAELAVLKEIGEAHQAEAELDARLLTSAAAQFAHLRLSQRLDLPTELELRHRVNSWNP